MTPGMDLLEQFHPFARHAEVRLLRAFVLHRLGMSLRGARPRPLPIDLVVAPLLHTLLRAWHPLGPAPQRDPRWTAATLDGLLATRSLFARIAGLDDTALIARCARAGDASCAPSRGPDFAWDSGGERAVVDPAVRPERDRELLLAAGWTTTSADAPPEIAVETTLRHLRQLLDHHARYRLLVYTNETHDARADALVAHLSAHATPAGAERWLFVVLPRDATQGSMCAWRLRREGGRLVRVAMPLPWV